MAACALSGLQGSAEFCRPDKRSAIRQRYEVTAGWRRTPYPAYGEVRSFVGRISTAPSGKGMRSLPDGGLHLIRPNPAYGEVRSFVGRISEAPSGKVMRPLPDGGLRLIRPTRKYEVL